MAVVADYNPIVPEQRVLDLIIKPLVTNSIAGQVLTEVITDSHDWRIPIVNTDPTASWTAEGAEISATDADIDELTVTPKKLAALSVISNELANDSNPAAANVIGEGIVRDLTRKVDQALFATSAITNGPAYTLGTQSGVSTVSAGAAYTTIDAFSDAVYVAADNNAVITHWVTNPATAKTLAKVKEQTGSNKPLLGADPTSPGQRQILGVPLLTSPYVPTTDNVVWGISKMYGYMVIREKAEVEADNSVFFTSDRVAVRAKVRVGFGFPAPLTMVKITTTA
ncbi:phage major capsid protein [Gordonia sp. Z-3]|uniref:phage major capsid protein n=1 Tax=Gordonia sp. Z-3 TaxID=3115408 RepID=UPI002E2B40DC|nr:phage major capsid protein [Gordonia sp. Z-3]MED5802947.1 phage major capsid protein [Gordonia sp. Z-3]